MGTLMFQTSGVWSRQNLYSILGTGFNPWVWENPGEMISLLYIFLALEKFHTKRRLADSQSMGSQTVRAWLYNFSFHLPNKQFLTCPAHPPHWFISCDYEGWSSHYFMLSNFNSSLLCTCFFLWDALPFYTMFLKLYHEKFHIVGMQTLYYKLMLLIC